MSSNELHINIYFYLLLSCWLASLSAPSVFKIDHWLLPCRFFLFWLKFYVSNQALHGQRRKIQTIFKSDSRWIKQGSCGAWADKLVLRFVFHDHHKQIMCKLFWIPRLCGCIQANNVALHFAFCKYHEQIACESFLILWLCGFVRLDNLTCSSFLFSVHHAKLHRKQYPPVIRRRNLS